MKIGISSLSHIVSSCLQLRNKELHEILMHATRSCLEFSEMHDLNVCEILIDPATTFVLDHKYSFITLCNEFKIKKQVHAALIDVSLCSNNAKISNATLFTFKNDLDIAKEINAATITIHPGISNLHIPVYKEQNHLTLIRQLKNLISYSKDFNVKICLENMDPNAGLCRNAKEIGQIHKDIANSQLFITYDTSHLWMNSSDYRGFIQELYPYIKNVHLADNLDKKHDEHPTIGTGNVPFPEIIQELKSFEYENSLIIEVLDVNGLEKSIDYVREILL